MIGQFCCLQCCYWLNCTGAKVHVRVTWQKVGCHHYMDWLQCNKLWKCSCIKTVVTEAIDWVAVYSVGAVIHTWKSHYHTIGRSKCDTMCIMYVYEWIDKIEHNKLNPQSINKGIYFNPCNQFDDWPWLIESGRHQHNHDDDHHHVQSLSPLHIKGQGVNTLIGLGDKAKSQNRHSLCLSSNHTIYAPRPLAHRW